MARRKVRLNLVAIALAIAAVVAFQVLTGTAPVTPAVAGSGCEGDLGKIDGGDHSYEADGIGSVCVKAGNNVIVFQCGDAGDGCYTLDWTQGADGCCTAVTVGGGKIRFYSWKIYSGANHHNNRSNWSNCICLCW